VLPARGLSARAPGGGEINGLAEYARTRIEDSKAPLSDAVRMEEPIVAGDEPIGVVLLLAGEDGADDDGAELVDRSAVLHAASLAALAEIAVSDAREEAVQDLRGNLIEELRGGAVDAADATQRAARLGCDLVRGAVVLTAQIRSGIPGHARALVSSEYDGALAEVVGDRLYAVLPARGADDAPERTLESAARLVRRLRPSGPAAVSSFYPDPSDLHRALRESELICDLIARDERIAESLEDDIVGSGVYRLLFRALISDPDEVRSFYDETVEPLVRYDRQYNTDLLGTLEQYMTNDCNMNATARAIYAHRHTVAYRLDRVRELTGLDPALSEDRERLGLGAKVYRILAPTLPR
jgi:sugar diacid utilization regulator